MFRGCGLFACARRGGDLRKRGEMGAASSRVAPAETEPVGLQLVEDDSAAAARQLTWAEVETATAGFTSPVIGHGGFSTVYLASLPASSAGSRLGAVKVHCSSKRLHRAFRQELDVLLSLRHPNIVRLLGYCDEQDEDEGALVFEYAPNGDLHRKLHDASGVLLPWSRRVAVAFQLATALEYLHESRQPAVVHGDIKASNVLLDAHMDAKLCDFGFAHVGFSAAVRGRPSARSIMGSPGYVDPHLLRSGVATKKSDVYSFGVLLLELLTGKEAFCRETGQRLTAAVGPILSERGKVSDVVDQRLGDKYDGAEAAAVAELAMRCISDSPGLRPSMADVVRVLREKTSVPASTVGSKSDRKL